MGTLGYNLYRQGGEGERVRLNAALIPTQNPGGLMGGAYSFLDEAVTLGVAYDYWLEAVDVHGGARLHGPVLAGVWQRVYVPLVVRR